MFASIAKCFQISYIFVCCSTWIDEYFRLGILWESFLLFPCGSSIRLFSYVSFVPIIWTKIVLFPCPPVVGMSPCNLPLLAGRIFSRCYWMFCFVFILLFYLAIFSVSSFHQYLPICMFCCFSLNIPTYACVFFPVLHFCLLSWISYLCSHSNFPFRFWASVRVL